MPLKLWKHASLFTQLDRPTPPHSNTLYPHHHRLFSKALNQLIFPLPPVCLFLIPMLLGCGKYLFTSIDDGPDGSFMSVRTQTVFVPQSSPNINRQWEKCGADCRLGQSRPKGQTHCPTEGEKSKSDRGGAFAYSERCCAELSVFMDNVLKDKIELFPAH